MISNLAYPEWISVSCKKQYLRDVLCVMDERVKENYTNNLNKISRVRNKYCSVESIQRGKYCISIVWKHSKPSDLLYISSYLSVEMFFPILNTISVKIEPIFLLSKRCVHLLILRFYFNRSGCNSTSSCL